MKALYPFLLMSLVIAMSLNAPAGQQAKPGFAEKSYRFEKVLEFSDWMGLSIEPRNISADRLKRLLGDRA